MRLCGLGLVLLLAASPMLPQVASNPRSTEGAAERSVIAAARARAAAFANRDCQRWDSYVDGKFRNIEGNSTGSREQTLTECEHGITMPDYRMERLLSDFHFQLVGSNVAVLDYRYEVREHFGEVVLNDLHRQIDTYEKREGQWIALIAVSATTITDPPVSKTDPASLDAFVGQFEWNGSHMLDTVTRKGDQLFIRSSGDLEDAELLPESVDKFFVSGQLTRVEFLRDKDGE